MGTPIANRLRLERLRAGRQVTERIEKNSVRCQTACCPSPFSLGLKRFLTNLRLATAVSKLALRAQTVDIANLPLRQDLLAKKRFNDRSKEFLFGQRPVRKMNIETRNPNDGLFPFSACYLNGLK